VIGFGMLFGLTTSLTFLSPHYRLDRLLVLLMVIVLVVIAVCLPLSGHVHPTSLDKHPGLGRLRLVGFGGTLLFFGAIYIVPTLLASPLSPVSSVLSQGLIMLSILMVCVFLLGMVHRWSAHSTWKEDQRLALITGSLLPTILFSFLLPQTWLAAQPAVTLPFLVLLVWAAYRQRKTAVLENKKRLHQAVTGTHAER
jgi:hypothetical protein